MTDDAPPLVVHVIWRLDIGGMENGLVNLINQMPSSHYRHAIICLMDATDFRKRLQKPVEIIELHRPVHGQDPGLQWQLWKHFRRLRPAIVHTRNAATIEASIAAKLAGVPAVVHGEHGWDSSDPDGSNRKRQILRRLCKPFINEFIALSAFQVDYLRDKIKVKPQHIAELCNGVDTERFSVSKNRAVLPAGFAADDSIVIGTVGRHDPIKDPENLLHAFVHVYHHDSRARLVFVGDGVLSDKLRALALELSVADRLWFAGARDDIPTLLNALDIFVLPSRSEGISNSILEAMACGLPVVATDVGGNSQLISSDTGSLMVANDPQALAAGILPYLADASLRRVTAKNARESAERNFSLMAMVNRYEAVYDKALSEH